jgi:LAO/AO transport system kinase
MGDALQAIKAGVMEVGDIMVVTKSDLPGADDVTRTLRMALGTGRTLEGWRVPIVSTSAATSTGFDDVLGALDQHQEHGRIHELRRRAVHDRARRRITEGAVEMVRSELSMTLLDDLVDDYLVGAVTLDAAAQRLAGSVRGADPK